MQIQMAFPNLDECPDPEFVAFALLAGTTIAQVAEGAIDSKTAVMTLWGATRPGVKVEVVNFTDQLMDRVKPTDIVERLGLGVGTEFRGAGVRFNAPNGAPMIEMMCVGLREPLDPNSPPPEGPEEVEQEFNLMVAEAAHDAGFVISAKNLEQEGIISESPGIADALRTQLDKKIEAETQQFRDELDKVFDTWKGGDAK